MFTYVPGAKVPAKVKESEVAGAGAMKSINIVEEAMTLVKQAKQLQYADCSNTAKIILDKI